MAFQFTIGVLVSIILGVVFFLLLMGFISGFFAGSWFLIILIAGICLSFLADLAFRRV